MNRQYQSAQCSIQSWNKSWTIEDEQCQRIGGRYEAVRVQNQRGLTMTGLNHWRVDI
jgi:hypothetical protein